MSGRCPLFIKCALCIGPRGTNKQVNKVLLLFSCSESTNRLCDKGAKCQMTTQDAAAGVEEEDDDDAQSSAEIG